MTIGIYILRFNGTDMVYIGKSKSIETRFTKHKYRLTNRVANYKLMGAYDLYGYPTLEILVECAKEDLEVLENEAIEIFDAVNNGLNINSKSSGGIGLSGENHGNSKYTNESIEKVFLLLVANEICISTISEKTGVSIDTIRDISKCKAHRWLKDKYPNEYLTLESLIGTRNKGISSEQLGLVFPLLESPTGKVFTITNISEFSRQHGLNKSHLSGVLNSKRKSHLGWKLK